jgi:nucleotide-binding universal stress UspA family protein
LPNPFADVEEQMRYSDIVVGIDGSGTSRTALRWAVAEARLRAARLRILAAYWWTWPSDEFDGLSELPQYLGQRFEEMAAEAVAEARALEPGVEVTGGAVLSEPASALLEAGRTAAMVVVGNRGHGGFASLLLGSVSQQVATHAAGPVIVVRGRADPPSGPIAVGVDASPSAQHALELGFEEAQRRDCELVAVRSYPVPSPPRGDDVPPPLYDQDAVRAAAAENLNAALAPWREKYPTVPVKAVIGPGSPAKNLVDASSEAGLLIVGSRGHGALVGSLLGSVGLQLLHHADCPVMIVHSEPAT